jgi:hypothetical protein
MAKKSGTKAADGKSKSDGKSDGKPDGKPTGDGEHWGTEPEEHDYPAAATYLSLTNTPTEVRRLVNALKAAPVLRYMAKDLLRASSLALLGPDNAHVMTDLAKVKAGKPLSPVLLVRGDLVQGVPLTVADGYHRICASYHLDENALIPCHLAELRPAAARTASRGTKGPASVQ